MTPTVLVLKDDELIARRAALVKRAGKSVEQMRKLAGVYQLDQERQAILRQIDELDFLLEE